MARLLNAQCVVDGASPWLQTTWPGLRPPNQVRRLVTAANGESE
jgi:hypothetical protein